MKKKEKKKKGDSGKVFGPEICSKCQKNTDCCNRISGSFYASISFQREQLDSGVEFGLLTGKNIW